MQCVYDDYDDDDGFRSFENSQTNRERERQKKHSFSLIWFDCFLVACHSIVRFLISSRTPTDTWTIGFKFYLFFSLSLSQIFQCQFSIRYATWNLYFNLVTSYQHHAIQILPKSTAIKCHLKLGHFVWIPVSMCFENRLKYCSFRFVSSIFPFHMKLRITWKFKPNAASTISLSMWCYVMRCVQCSPFTIHMQFIQTNSKLEFLVCGS